MLELIELLDDEEYTVKIEAFNCLADVFKNCTKQDVDAVGIIEIVEGIYKQAIIKKPGTDFLCIIIEQSVKIIYTCDSIGVDVSALVQSVLNLFDSVMKTQEKATQQSLKEELGYQEDTQDENKGKKKTFLELLNSGDLNFGKMLDEQQQD